MSRNRSLISSYKGHSSNVKFVLLLKQTAESTAAITALSACGPRLATFSVDYIKLSMAGWTSTV
jgi:hypothetical protein